MKALLRIVVLSSLLGTSSCLALEQSIPRTLNVRVVDEAGEPVQGAESKIGFSFVGSTRGLTDEGGQISHTGRQTGTWFVQIEKKGYYETSGTGPMAAPPGLVEVVLKRKIDPVAMVVGRVPDGFLPTMNKLVGYDLEKADWLPPYGNGLRRDLEFFGKMTIAENSEKSYPETWQAELMMSFPNPDDGLIVFSEVIPSERNDPESELISIQEAPENGYNRSGIIQELSRDPRYRTETFDWDTHYVVFRVRTEKDKEGRILRANYGKIYDPMKAGPLFPKDSMWLKSLFYFNPTPNDHSIEFNRENLHSDPPIRNLPY